MKKNLTGKEIKQIRRDLGMTQRAFAADLGVTHPYLSDLERGVRAPSQQLLNLILTKIKLKEPRMDQNELIIHTLKMQDQRIAQLQATVDALEAEIGRLKERMIDASASGDIHKLYPTITRNH